ncbi:dihydrodipicolinate synthase family protein [Pararhodobacter sp.]|uniref:dihydrodipicolinate synthase family protein n=1 Tax=Pararhodobacter sp. TaxID=2127056 RepID=UPI002FDD8F93
MPRHFAGLLVPAITPFTAEGLPDSAAFVAICRWLLAQGADGLAVFGTTSEGTSLTVAERMTLLDAAVEGGIPPEVLMPGVGSPALGDTIALTRHAVALGCGGVLSLPPFYYKPASVEGLFAWYAGVIEGVASDNLGLWLYHIPQISGVGIPYALIERLIAAFPANVPGIKDSSGDWANTEGMLKNFPGFRVFPSSEAVLLKAMALGAVGCITATGNINPHGIRALLDARGTPQAEGLQAKAAAIRAILAVYPLIQGCKAVLSAELNDTRLAPLRPPLTPLPADQAQALRDRLAQAGWRVPGPLDPAHTPLI